MRFTHRAGLALAFLILLGMSTTSSTQAQTFYSSRASFTAASSALTTLTFDNLIGTPGYPNNFTNGTGYVTHSTGGLTVNGVNFVGQNNNDGVPYETFILDPSVDAGFYSLNGTPGLLGGLASLTVTLPTGVTSFGTDIGEQKTGDPIIIDAQITLANSQTFTQVLNFTAGNNEFFGFTAASPIATVLFSNPNDPHDGIPYAIYDNVSFGSAAAPVPEASTTVSLGLLLALGMGGMVIAAKRKKARAS